MDLFHTSGRNDASVMNRAALTGAWSPNSRTTKR